MNTLKQSRASFPSPAPGAARIMKASCFPTQVDDLTSAQHWFLFAEAVFISTEEASMGFSDEHTLLRHFDAH